MHRTFVRSWFQVALALGSIAVTVPTRADVAAASHSLELGAGLGYRLAQDSAWANRRVPIQEPVARGRPSSTTRISTRSCSQA